jgi:DNA-binding NarL/FixJ family response regulator
MTVLPDMFQNPHEQKNQMTPPTKSNGLGLVKVLLAEDHELTRFGIRFALEKFPQLQVIGEAPNGVEVLRLISQSQPDVVLMDIGMPEMDGIETTRKLKAYTPNIKVIMLTSKDEDKMVYAALSAGADAYCMKDIKTERLVQVIDMVMEGVMWLDPAIARLVVQGLPDEKGQQKGQNVEASSAIPVLNLRELTLLKCIASNQGVADIARTMMTQPNQVSDEIVYLLKKLAVDMLQPKTTHSFVQPANLQSVSPPPQFSNVSASNVSGEMIMVTGGQTQASLPEALDSDWALTQSMNACVQNVEYKDKLIPRELEILRLLVEGFNVWDIAKQFQISPEWVNAHLNNVMGKMCVNTPEAAVERAKRDRLFQQRIFQ